MRKETDSKTQNTRERERKRDLPDCIKMIALTY
jgi:hypothetical protein